MPADAPDSRLREAEALLLLTNRVLLDFLSLQVSSGAYDRPAVMNLVSFSEEQVIKGSPDLEPLIRQFAATIRDRMAPGPTQDDQDDERR